MHAPLTHPSFTCLSPRPRKQHRCGRLFFRPGQASLGEGLANTGPLAKESAMRVLDWRPLNISPTLLRRLVVLSCTDYPGSHCRSHRSPLLFYTPIGPTRCIQVTFCSTSFLHFHWSCTFPHTRCLSWLSLLTIYFHKKKDVILLVRRQDGFQITNGLTLNPSLFLYLILLAHSKRHHTWRHS